MQKKLLLLVFSAVAIFSTAAENRADSIRQKLLNRDNRSVIVASHRGDWRNFCENSLEAIDNAAKMGVDIVEIDVQRTKDGQLILMHDPKLDRTTTGKGLIADTTLAYICRPCQDSASLSLWHAATPPSMSAHDELYECYSHFSSVRS